MVKIAFNQGIKYWKVHSSPLSGSSYEEVKKQADQFFVVLKGKTKRKVSVHSKFFKKKKVFFDYFWDHLFQKPKRQRLSRLKLLPCAAELLKNGTIKPDLKPNPNKRDKLLYRFYGVTRNNQYFVVQVKNTGKSLQMVSVFPWK